MTSAPEDLLAFQLKASKIEFQRQYKFHPERRWKADFMIPAGKLLIEVDGGTWTNGRHTRGTGYAKDCEKLNEATILGWAVLRFPTAEIKPGRAVQTILRYLNGSKE